MIIYKTTNIVNGKIYIGQTNGKCKYYLGGGKLLKEAFKKYNKENFTFEILEEGEFDSISIDTLEKHYIKLYRSNIPTIGYNLENGGKRKGKLSTQVIQSRCKKVNQYDLKGILVKEYNSIKEATELIKGDRKFIIQCCKKKKNRYMNSLWKYKE